MSKSEILDEITKNPFSFKRAPDEFQNDKEIVLVAVNGYGGVLQDVLPKFKNDKT